MKVLCSLLAWIGGCLLSAGMIAAQGTWQVQSIPTDETFYDVFFTSRWNGWAMGTSFYSDVAFHTTDGGRTWNQVGIPSDGRTISTISFADSLNGWAGGAFAGDSFLLRTTDGGRSWSEIRIEPRYLTKVFFVDRQRGWFVSGVVPRIWHSGDGGLTWQPQSTPDGIYGLSAITFTDSLNGWACGARTDVHDSISVVIHTNDGGRHWEFQRIPWDGHSNGLLNGIHFVDPKHGWAIGSSDASVIHTADGGTTWARQIFLGDDIGLGDFVAEDLSFADTLNGWVVGPARTPLGEAAVFRTRDGGRTWQVEYMGLGSVLEAVSFVDSSHGWAAGWYGTMLTYQSGPVHVKPDGSTSTGQAPKLLGLHQNYPNPFNDSTEILYELAAPKAVHLRLVIFNLSGEEVRTLVDEEQQPGHHRAVWDGRDSRGQLVATGLYIYELASERMAERRQMILLK